jgi:hypothetical protein
MVYCLLKLNPCLSTGSQSLEKLALSKFVKDKAVPVQVIQPCVGCGDVAPYIPTRDTRMK